MNQLVIMKNQEAVTSSLNVAEGFEKEHKHVLRDLDNLKGVVQNWTDLFHEDTYTHPQNKQQYRIVYMNRDGFTLLAMGFTGKKALQFKLKYIEAFNEMEQHIAVPQTRAEALRLAADLDEENQQLRIENAELQPKAQFADAVKASHTSILVGDLAKLISQNGVEIGQNRLFKWLREHGYLISRRGESFNMPTQRSIDDGLIEIKERTQTNPDGSIRICRTPKVTGKGQVYFVQELI